MAFKENYQQPVNKSSKQQSWWILKWLTAAGLAISKQSHILHSLQAPQKYLSYRPGKKKKLSSGLAITIPSQYKSVRRMHQWLGSRKTGHPYTKGILDKNYVSRSTLQGQLTQRYEITSLQPANSKLPVQTFLPCSRKKGLFGHIVAKSHKA
jgi:hypothetical protein